VGSVLYEVHGTCTLQSIVDKEGEGGSEVTPNSRYHLVCSLRQGLKEKSHPGLNPIFCLLRFELVWVRVSPGLGTG